jgi:hypothetical protein
VVSLSNPGGGATLNSLKTATVTIQHGSSGGTGGSGGGGGSITHPSPTITSLLPVAGPAGISNLVVSFSTAMDPRTASRVGYYGYYVLTPGPDGVFGTYDDGLDAITSATYVASTYQTILHLATPLQLGPSYLVVFDRNAFPSPFMGISDASGNVLNGSGAGAGTPYVAYFSEGQRLSYTDSAGDAVSLSLTGPGLMVLTRYGSGDAQQLRILAAAPGVTSLSGTVVPRRNSFGIATIPSITGASGVRVLLKTPPFQLGTISASAVDRLAASGTLSVRGK